MGFVSSTKLLEVLLVADTDMDKRDVKSVIYLLYGVVYGVHVVVTSYDQSLEIKNTNKNYENLLQRLTFKI